jgi:DNA polymerase elongation subunit (family B)
MEVRNTFDVQAFLEGENNKKNIIGIETSNENNVAILFTHDVITQEKGYNYVKFEPFLYVKDLAALGIPFYDGMNDTKKNNAKALGIKFTKRLKDNGHQRVKDGYVYKVTSTISFKAIVDFFKKGGIDIYHEDYQHLFIRFNVSEQFLIQHKMRLFKGVKKYQQLHKLYFDIETTGLDASVDRVFLIGVKLNWNPITKEYADYDIIYEASEAENDEEERNIIIDFFKLINATYPDLIIGHNIYNFDWVFLLKRAEILEINLDEHIKPKFNLEVPKYKKMISTRKSMIKLGAEVEEYVETKLYTHTIVDTAHAVRRAMGQNTDIKSWSLKYIAEYHDVAKKNRVYVPGDKIYSLWKEDNTLFTFNSNNKYIIFNSEHLKSLRSFYKKFILGKEINDDYETWYKENYKFFYDLDSNFYNSNELDDNLIEHFLQEISFSKDDKGKTYSLLSGRDIIKQYLRDDLHETKAVDEIYCEPNFFDAMITPASYERISTMGNTAWWKLILVAYYFHTDKAIPSTKTKRKITGGLNRLIKIGYNKRVFKGDFAGLYPSLMEFYKIFPNFDIDQVFENILIFLGTKRNEYKKMMKKYEDLADYEEAKYYDLLQRPLKLRRNSGFGAEAAANIFPWGEPDLAEKITCFGRQHMRDFVYWMKHNYGFEPLVMNTDGCNFETPEEIDFYYVHLIDKKTNGQIYTTKVKSEHKDEYLNKLRLEGYPFDEEKHIVKLEYNIDLIIDEYNNTRLTKPMKIDNDGVFISTINLAKNNYANYYIDAKGKEKIKMVGGSFHNVNLQKFIKEFIDEGVKLLIKEKGYEFQTLYIETLKQCYYGNIPALKIASKDKVKYTFDEYRKRFETKNKNGKDLPRLAYMELLMKEGVEKKKGEVVLYVNNGTKKTDTDINTGVLIDERAIESNPNLVVDYNVKRYVEIFNKRVKPLLCVFKEEVAQNFLVDKPDDFKYFTEEDLKLVSKNLKELEEAEVRIKAEKVREKGLKKINAEFEKQFKKLNKMIKPKKDKSVELTQEEYEIKLNEIIEEKNSKLAELEIEVKNSLIQFDEDESVKINFNYNEKSFDEDSDEDNIDKEVRSGDLKDVFTLDEKEVNFWLTRTFLDPRDIFENFYLSKDSKRFQRHVELIEKAKEFINNTPKFRELQERGKVKFKGEYYTKGDIVFDKEDDNLVVYYFHPNDGLKKIV